MTWKLEESMILAFSKTSSVAFWAAKGVDFLAPLKPDLPLLDQAITLPSRSVSVTILLFCLAER